MQYVESKDFENRLQLSILRGVVKVGLQKRYNVHTFCTLPVTPFERGGGGADLPLSSLIQEKSIFFKQLYLRN